MGKTKVGEVQAWIPRRAPCHETDAVGINAIGCYIQTWQSRARAAHTTRSLQITSEATNRDGQENPRTPVSVLHLYHP